jgi:hypothetical protein
MSLRSVRVKTGDSFHNNVLKAWLLHILFLRDTRLRFFGFVKTPVSRGTNIEGDVCSDSLYTGAKPAGGGGR